VQRETTFAGDVLDKDGRAFVHRDDADRLSFQVGEGLDLGLRDDESAAAAARYRRSAACCRLAFRRVPIDEMPIWIAPDLRSVKISCESL
jgi:hypothetical protein